MAVDRSSDEPLTLGEILPARGDDPATQACRRVDWGSVIQKLDEITRAVLICLATCEELTSLVKRFRRSRSMIQNHKDRLARLIKECLGQDILQQVQEQPGWHNGMHATREKLSAVGNDPPSDGDERGETAACPFSSLSGLWARNLPQSAVKPCSTGEVLITFQNCYRNLESEAPPLLGVGRFSLTAETTSNLAVRYVSQERPRRNQTAESRSGRVNCISDLPRALASVTLPGAGWGYSECIHLRRTAGAHKKFQPFSSNPLGLLWK